MEAAAVMDEDIGHRGGHKGGHPNAILNTVVAIKGVEVMDTAIRLGPKVKQRLLRCRS